MLLRYTAVRKCSNRAECFKMVRCCFLSPRCGILHWRKQDLSDQVAIGHEILARGDLAAAEKHFRDLVSIEPQNVFALSALVRISRRLRKRSEVLKFSSRVLELEPEALFEGAVLALVTSFGNLAGTRARIPQLLTIAARQGLKAQEADLLIRVIQIAYAGRQRIEALTQVQKLLLRSLDGAGEPSLNEQVTAAELSLALEDHDDLVKRTKELQALAKGRLTARIDALAIVAAKLTAADYPNYKAAKVFGIGLSRTGTSSLDAALKTLGYHTMHWLNPITRDLIQQRDFLLFDAFSDICVSYQFEWLYHTYPNSKFILTTRPLNSWVRSVENHYHLQHDTALPSGLTTPSARGRFRTQAGQIEANIYGNHDTWHGAYTAFSERVEGFFQGKPCDRFLKLAITEGQGYETLCPFLDRPIPQEDFPTKNQSPAQSAQVTHNEPKTVSQLEGRS